MHIHLFSLTLQQVQLRTETSNQPTGSDLHNDCVKKSAKLT